MSFRIILGGGSGSGTTATGFTLRRPTVAANSANVNAVPVQQETVAPTTAAAHSTHFTNILGVP